jgi:hypothetical protein
VSKKKPAPQTSGRDDRASPRSAKVAQRPLRLPPASDVLAESTLVSPKGNRYRIVRSTETDPKDKP